VTTAVEEVRNNYTHARHTTRAIYAFLAGYCFVSLKNWRIWHGSTGINFHPVWPVAWIRPDNVPSIWLCSTLLSLSVTSLTMIYVDSRSLRIVAAVCLCLHFAVEDSRDTIRHNEHGLLWTTLILAALPGMTKSSHDDARQKLRFIGVFKTAQCMLLLFYCMAGIVKVATSVAQGLRGERTLLHPDSGAMIIAEWLLRGDPPSLLGHWFVEHKVVAWIAILGSVVIELMALSPLVYRSFQPGVGLGLIGVHVGIGLAMDVWFPENVALLALMILGGPPIARRAAPSVFGTG
jgi:hypothetical protein